MTREALNAFIEATETAMTEQEREEWFALSKFERQFAAWTAYLVLHPEAA